MALSDSWLGHAVRSLPQELNEIYLTFDDGPDPEGTPAVLDLLHKHQGKATFFVIAEHARLQPQLLQRMLKEGHAIGNHSLDHRYRRYFSDTPKLKEWVSQAEQQLQELCGQPTVGFRPPAGLRTPPLAKALTELNEPMILWSTRYYDSVWGWPLKAARAHWTELAQNNIVLLHDRQRRKNLSEFLKTLDWFLNELKQQDFSLRALSRWQCLSAWQQLRS
jgi:peptidoglycan/xylan/chitin deacetylase (PgdA/CDA1 family)